MYDFNYVANRHINYWQDCEIHLHWVQQILAIHFTHTTTKSSNRNHRHYKSHIAPHFHHHREQNYPILPHRSGFHSCLQMSVHRSLFVYHVHGGELLVQLARMRSLLSNILNLLVWRTSLMDSYGPKCVHSKVIPTDVTTCGSNVITSKWKTVLGALGTYRDKISRVIWQFGLSSLLTWHCVLFTVSVLYSQWFIAKHYTDYRISSLRFTYIRLCVPPTLYRPSLSFNCIYKLNPISAWGLAHPSCAVCMEQCASQIIQLQPSASDWCLRAIYFSLTYS